MLKIDISKAISPRFGTYLLGIIPGLFFVSSIALGQPHLVPALISRVREIYPFGPYALLAISLASALFIGQGFFLLAWIVDLLIVAAFVLWRYAIKITLGSGWLYHRFGKLQGTPLNKMSSSVRWGELCFGDGGARSLLKLGPF